MKRSSARNVFRVALATLLLATRRRHHRSRIIVTVEENEHVCQERRQERRRSKDGTVHSSDRVGKECLGGGVCGTASSTKE